MPRCMTLDMLLLVLYYVPTAIKNSKKNHIKELPDPQMNLILNSWYVSTNTNLK